MLSTQALDHDVMAFLPSRKSAGYLDRYEKMILNRHFFCFALILFSFVPLVLFSTSSSAQLSAESFQSTPAKRTLEDDVRQLLSDAEAALASNKLTTPLHDNAFDRFQAVLLLRPNNQQAKTGLQQIFARYAALTRSALASSQLHQAREYIERAKFVDKNSPEISQLIKEVAIAQQRLN